MCKYLVIHELDDHIARLVDELRSDGHDVIYCSSFSEGRQAFVQHAPEVVICDTRLPDGNGVELIYRLKRLASEFKAIVASAELADWDPDDLIDCGADSVMTDPCDYKNLHCG